MQDYLDILGDAVSQWTSPSSPVSDALSASELERQLDLRLGQPMGSVDELKDAIGQYLRYSPNTTSVGFFKLLYSGLNKEALLGDWITSLCNSTMHTYQVGPVATLMELELIRQWNALVGFDKGDGVMVSGGSQANLIGMLLARHKACPELKLRGSTYLKQALVGYVSDQAHYSFERAANVLGIGSENLIKVESDEFGRICPISLNLAIKKDIAEGRRPFFIGLTAGTTVVGAYDPVTECSEIAQKYDLWLHVDGAWGAPVLFSDRHRNLLGNSHLADSFAWDAHKLINVPITAAVILVKQAGLLQECSAGGGGDYLFHRDANSDYNLGERSIQCGRRADALKVWLSWKAMGNKGFEDKVDCLQALKAHCLKVIESKQQLTLLAPADYLNVLFRYQPKISRSEEYIARLNIEICKTMRLEGGPYVDYANYKGKTGIRLIVANDEIHQNQLDDFFRICVSIGQKFEATLS